MDNSDSDGQGHKLYKIRRSTSSKSSTKGHRREKRSQSFDQGSSLTMEHLTLKSNGYVQDQEQAEEESGKHSITIKDMWKKAVKVMKSTDKPSILSKKGSVHKRKDSESVEEVIEEQPAEIDPVYSLLKCAADLPKVPVKVQKDSVACPHHAGPSHGHSMTHSASQHNMDSSHAGHRSTSPISPGGQRSTSPISSREHMHHIVDESLGSEFRTFYKLTSPVKKDGHHKKTSPSSSFDHY